MMGRKEEEGVSVRGLGLRILSYVRTQGMFSALKRSGRELKNLLFHNRLVLFRIDLQDASFDHLPNPEHLRVERIDSAAAVPERLVRRTAEYYSEALFRDNIRRRFELGAVLWVLQAEGEDLGYFWTITGRTLQPRYFFPLDTKDVHLDDALIFPPFRGRGYQVVLTGEILRQHRMKGFRRCYVEVAEWNTPMLRSLAKLGFERIGLARLKLRRRTSRVKWWHGDHDPV